MQTHSLATVSTWQNQLVELLRHASVASSEALTDRAVALGRQLARTGAPVEVLARVHTAALTELQQAIHPEDTETLSNTGPLWASVIDAYYAAQQPQSSADHADDDELEHFYRRLCAAAPFAVCLVDHEGRCVTANRLAQQLFACVEGDCVGYGWLEWLPEPERERILHAFRRAHKLDAPFEREACYQRADGSEEWLLIRSRPLPDPSARERWRVVSVEAITRRKRAQQALADSEAKFRVLAETVPTGILIYRGQDYLFVNQMMELITGYTREELTAMSFWEIVHPEMRELVRSRGLARQAGVPVPLRYEIKILTKSGDTKWIDYSASLVNYEGSQAVLGAIIDVTNRKAAEDEARRRHGELVHVSRVSTLGNMASQLAHELNQPLAAIVNYANGCERRVVSGVPADPGIRQAIHEMKTQAQRASDIIKRIRRFSRKQPANQSEADINQIVRDAVALATAANPFRLPVEVRVDESLPPVFVDDIQVMQVILNVVRNGLEAMAQRGRGRMTIVTSQASEREVCVAIRDEGPGLENVEPEELFEPFKTTKADGLGIGLPISRDIIELHGGKLWATVNDDGPGLTVQFTLPIGTAGGYS
jgi:two-component system sensor kinase FixL